ncbi:MAG: 2-amino-4-hydroxy-6-hydroxymethyldihydropteridine diphosphokinase [Phycisphaeraceae bacterium]|nr:2-amino-4-hydroxy-6-hydroxymethyldihydropteridine diphosphokinase [Phycisphaeraceae bacterium]
MPVDDEISGQVSPGNRSAVVAYIGLGSNLGEKAVTLESAICQIARLPDTRVIARSDWMQTSPVGVTDQPDFLNGVIAIETFLPAQRLIEVLLRIEAEHGRDRATGSRWGPRTLDLDLLLYGSAMIEEAGLQVPHPRMLEREFVLAPLFQIAPHARIPGYGHTVAEALERLRCGD